MQKRILCLGNELLADDALGAVAARHLRELALPDTEVVFSEESGLRLLDYVQDVAVLIVVDCAVTGQVPPGVIRVLGEDQFPAITGSPHYLGLFDVLCLARALELNTPGQVVIVAVEAVDTLSMGEPLSAPLRACLPVLLDQVCALVQAAPAYKAWNPCPPNEKPSTSIRRAR